MIYFYIASIILTLLLITILLNLRFVLLDFINSYWITRLDDISKLNPAVCPNINCMRQYKGEQRKKLLKRHLIYECGVPKQFKCFQCHKEFAQKYSLKKHMVIVHRQLT